MHTTLIQNGTILPCVTDMREVISPGYIVIEGERIVQVEPGQPSSDLVGKCDEVISASGCAVIPGLVNAHTHLFQTFLRGLADDKPLLEWLAAATWPGALAMTEEDFYLSAKLGFMENLKCGATSVLSQDYVQTSTRNMDVVAQAAEEIGIRALLARGYADREPYREEFRETPEQVIKETQRLVKYWNHRNGGRIRVEFAPLIPWGCRGDTLQTISQLAKEWDVGVHIHVNETLPEVQMSLDEFGVRPIRWLADLGVLDEHWQLVHCVWLDEEEMDLIAKHGSLIIHNPVSNMYLASGIPKVVEWRKRGIPTALATDGPGSNNSQDMMEVLKFTACLQKVGTLNATALLPEDVLEMALWGGAKAMRLENQIGKLKPGALADIVLVNLRKAHIMPVHSAQSALVYNANGNDIDTVIVAGKVLVQNGKMKHVDEEKLLSDCQQAVERICKRGNIASKAHLFV
ncbi:MAG: amidohydrolase [Anaerolineae bacterium]|nr:amidohydrolase [Anaerolineae bacterium]